MFKITGLARPRNTRSFLIVSGYYHFSARLTEKLLESKPSSEVLCYSGSTKHLEDRVTFHVNGQGPLLKIL